MSDLPVMDNARDRPDSPDPRDFALTLDLLPIARPLPGFSGGENFLYRILDVACHRQGGLWDHREQQSTSSRSTSRCTAAPRAVHRGHPTTQVVLGRLGVGSYHPALVSRADLRLLTPTLYESIIDYNAL